jgi:hypothetical protein
MCVLMVTVRQACGQLTDFGHMCGRLYFADDFTLFAPVQVGPPSRRLDMCLLNSIQALLASGCSIKVCRMLLGNCKASATCTLVCRSRQVNKLGLWEHELVPTRLCCCCISVAETSVQ